MPQRPPRILFASPQTLFDVSNGASMQCYTMLQSLARRGLETASIGGGIFDNPAGEERIPELERQIEAMSAEIMQKENRQRELDRAVAQSSVFQEEEKLQRQKEALLQEQKKLIEGLQSLALDIRRESDRISHLCEDILGRVRTICPPASPF